VPSELMDLPVIGTRQLVYENKYQQIFRVIAEFGHLTKEYFVNDYGQRVGMVIVRGNEVLLVRQYRFLINSCSWEIPGGKVDPNESPVDAAVREALEETSLFCRNVEPLSYFHPGLDTLENPTFIFMARDFDQASPESFHAMEVTGQMWTALDECLKMVFARKIVDSLTIVALLALHTRRHHPELANS
jgi:ADP-ribose pyrophosphatase